MNIWMIGKNAMKLNYLKRKILELPKHVRYYSCRLLAP